MWSGVNSGSAGAVMASFGLYYVGSGAGATIDFLRASGAADGSLSFKTAASERFNINGLGASVTGTLGVTGVATFSAGSTSVVMNATSTYNAIRFNQSGSAQGFIGSDYGQAICTTSANGDMVIRADPTGTILFASSTTQIAKLTSTAATFSGNATAANFVLA